MTYLKIGFTGTRLGMSIDQSVVLRRKLSPGKGGTTWTMFSEFHHGDCVGADEEAHDMMRVMLSRHWPLRVDLVVHPPTDYRFRAGCGTTRAEREDARNAKGAVKVLPARGYLERDRDIVDATDLLIACPAGIDLRSHGGTAYTVRYARTQVKPILIIWGDGRVEMENFDLTPGQRAELKKKYEGEEMEVDIDG
jgi:hypothetical protein